MFFEQLGVGFDYVGRLAFQTHHVYAAGQGLQVSVRAGRFAERVHHIKGVFVAIEEQRLKAGTAAEFHMINAGVFGSFHGGHKVFG